MVIDEAYYAYSRNSFLDDLSNYENILLLRTVSKIGFAGIRLGLMIGSNDLIDEFNKIRLPYNINSLTQSAASFLLLKKDYFKVKFEEIKKERARLYDFLVSIKGIKVFNSDANFLFFQTPKSHLLFEYLLSQNILIKRFSDQSDLKNSLRVTIGSINQNNLFMKSIKKFYRE